MRTTAVKVREIIETTLTDAGIDGYIIGANSFVTTHLEDKGLSAPILVEIERWITAHFIAQTRERMARKEGAGGAEIEYIGLFGEGLKSTPYGQTAISLDVSGTLVLLNNGSKPIKVKAL